MWLIGVAVNGTVMVIIGGMYYAFGERALRGFATLT